MSTEQSFIEKRQNSNPPSRPAESNNPTNNNRGSHNAWGWVLLSILLLLIVLGVAWILYARWRARRLGLPPPRLNPFSDRTRIPEPSGSLGQKRGGFAGWVQDKWSSVTNTRTAGGAYEGTALNDTSGRSGARGGRRTFGPLDPDEAWDARVGHENEGYYEEQDLGLHEPASGPGGAYGGSGYGRSGYGAPGRLDRMEIGEDQRGRSRSRSDLTEPYKEATSTTTSNPFGDEHAEASLRGISPRPHIEDLQNQATSYQPGHRGQASVASIASQERKSLFHEQV